MFAIVGDKVVLSAHTGKVVEMNITSRLKKSEVVDTGKQTKTEENVALKRLLFTCMAYLLSFLLCLQIYS